MRHEHQKKYIAEGIGQEVILAIRPEGADEDEERRRAQEAIETVVSLQKEGEMQACGQNAADLKN